ncbi:9965_t:CDS:2 [Paraglomus brasilianum]|uniref:Endopeptidase S2P n=1 Tax=Paraglomus brasilianum TaxID=144538 RepID=A0A9N9ATL9_9GLOM|nr:9965_t:CDS:2 [Paraglomus brasilianum]
MIAIDLLIYFLVFWAIIHIIVRTIQQKFPDKKAHLSRNTLDRNLPLHTQQLKPKSTTIESSVFNVRITTTALNPFFKSLALKAPKFWRIWFTIGAWVGMFAMVCGVGLMVFVGGKLMLEFLGFHSHQHNGFHGMRRSLSVEHETFEENSFINFVLPGVTLPLSHAGYVLIGLFICGIIHEAGHAIAAANEQVTISSTGVFIQILYPGAFVDIPIRNLALLPCAKQIRIFCAGVWHNAVVFALGWLLISFCVIPSAMQFMGWKSTDGFGVNVVNVDQDTDLYSEANPSGTITRLDDYFLNGSSLEQWTKYLRQHEQLDYNPPIKPGFCSMHSKEASLECCAITADHPFGNADDKELVCFQYAEEREPDQRLTCLPMNTISTPDSNRCTLNADCPSNGRCVMPFISNESPNRVVRIYYKPPAWENASEKIVLYWGEFIGLWESVEVNTLQPRWWFIPTWIPILCETLLRYITSFSLALCIFNILPAFQLDGYYAMSTALLFWFGEEEREHVMLGMGRSKIEKQRRKLEKIVANSVTVLLAWVIIGSLIAILVGFEH